MPSPMGTRRRLLFFLKTLGPIDLEAESSPTEGYRLTAVRLSHSVNSRKNLVTIFPAFFEQRFAPPVRAGWIESSRKKSLEQALVLETDQLVPNLESADDFWITIQQKFEKFCIAGLYRAAEKLVMPNDDRILANRLLELLRVHVVRREIGAMFEQEFL